MAIEPIIISTQHSWDRFLKTLQNQHSVAIDMESNGFFAYREMICLIQIAADDSVALVDPFEIPDLSGLGIVLDDPGIEKIMHSSDYDLRSFDRDYGFRVRNLFDTSIAASFLGLRMLGLGNVLQKFLGVAIAKSKSLQRANWARRPLSEESIIYAANDVYYLHRLRDLLASELESLGRLSWVREECSRLEEIRFSEPEPPEEAWMHAKGVRKLTASQKSVFRELYLLRNSIASKANVPSFKVLSNNVMVELAVQPDRELSKVKGLKGRHTKGRLGDINQAITKGRNSRSLPQEKLSGNRKNRAYSSSVLKALKEWRKAQAASLNLDPALLWPMKDLEFIASDGAGVRVSGRYGANGVHLVRNWQKDVFGDSLASLLESLGRGDRNGRGCVQPSASKHD